jgi:tetratricopeptide (TPR) repeat protein
MQAHAFDEAERFLEYTAHVEAEPKPEERGKLLGQGYLWGDAERWHALAILRTYQGRFDEALGALASWSEAETLPERRPLIRAYEALVLLELGRVDEAEAAGREAFADLPWLALVKLVHGAVLVAKGAYAGGVKLLEEVDAPYESIAAAWRTIGLARLERPDEAREALEFAHKGLGAPPSLLERAQALSQAPHSP